MNIWEFILKYAGIFSLAITVAKLIHAIVQHSRRPFLSDSAVFAYKSPIDDITFCLVSHISNPSTKPISILNVSIAGYADDDVFIRAETESFCLIGTGSICRDSTPFPITLSPGESKRIFVGFHMEQSDIECLDVQKLYSFEELAKSVQVRQGEMIRLAKEHKKCLSIEPLRFQYQLQSQRKSYKNDTQAEYLDMDLFVLRLSSRSALEKHMKEH